MDAQNHGIVEAALAARTVEQTLEVQSKIKLALGEEFYRPLGEIWSNHGLMTSSGSSYDLKLMERVTGRRTWGTVLSQGVMSGLSTGFVDLDRQTNGFQPTELIIVAARPSMGKTALVCNIAEWAAGAGETAAVHTG